MTTDSSRVLSSETARSHFSVLAYPVDGSRPSELRGLFNAVQRKIPLPVLLALTVGGVLHGLWLLLVANSGGIRVGMSRF